MLRLRSRRQTPYARSVPVTVSTSFTALLPRSFDSPLARSRMCTGTSTTSRPASRRRRSDSTSGAPLVYGMPRAGIACRFAAYIPLVASRNGSPESGAHRPAKDRRAEPPAGGRLVAIRLVAFAGREPRPDGDVGLSCAHDLEQARELVDGMLTVGVDPPDELVPVLVGVRVTGGDALTEASVLTEREHLGAVGARNRGRAVRRTVVDDEDVARG